MKSKLTLVIFLFILSIIPGLKAQTTTVHLKAFLEGPFSSDNMLFQLNSFGYIPLSQPFNGFPWFYNGDEQVIEIPDYVVDWVLVELRETADGPNTADCGSIIAKKAGFILFNGNIVALDGYSDLQFDVQVHDNLFVVVQHRNHLAIMSSAPLVLSNGIYSYDFTMGSEKVYGGTSGCKQLSVGTFGLISGDGDASSQVNNLDKNLVWKPQSGTSGYKSGDFNMNSQVDNTDKFYYWMYNSGRASQVPLQGCNTPPVASFTMTPNPATSVTIVSFDASGSHDDQDPTADLLVRWDWEYDGIWDTPYSFTKTITHIFLLEGYYTVKLEVKDSGQLIDTETQTIEIIRVNGAPCPGVPNVTYGGQTYNTVQIGTQCWLKENLNIGTMIQGGINPTNNGSIEKYCYDNNLANCNIFGGLYQWNEMMQYSAIPGVQGICPEGWHIPTDNEWMTLSGFLEGNGGDIKTTGIFESGTGLWMAPNLGATNLSSFSGLPGGSRQTDGTFLSKNYHAFFWTSDDNNSNAYYRELFYNSIDVYQGNFNKSLGSSVRCIYNGPPPNLPPNQPSDPLPANGVQNQPLNSILSWNCVDPENDPLTYDVYFSNNTPPLLVSSGQLLNSFNPGTLTYSTNYYWKISVHDSYGNITEGPIWSFTTLNEPIWTCNDTLVDNRDGQSYPTTRIGKQCWMAKNLNIGTIIQKTINQQNNNIIEKYCYNNNITSCITYGGLYQWDEMMQYVSNPETNGICPEGWHLPTSEEWIESIDSLGGASIAGGKMKESGTIHWFPPNTGGTNISNFTALPGGLSNPDGFYNLGYLAFFWTSTDFNGSNSEFISLSYDSESVNNNVTAKSWGLSVRCVSSLGIPSTLSIINTSNVFSKTQISATSGGHILYDGGAEVTDRGVCWNTYGNPTINDFHTSDGTGDGYFASYLTGLNSNTTYYLKAFATNTVGTAYGNEMIFTTPMLYNPPCEGLSTLIFEGQTYNTVEVGDQCWLKENLNIGSIINGDINQEDNGIIEKYCYDNDTSNCSVYGGLYQWDEMMQYSRVAGAKGICPDGWHVPTESEWCILEQEIDPTTNCENLGQHGIDGGGKLKETGIIHWIVPNTGATNSSGLMVYPGGFRSSISSFESLGHDANIWTSDESNTSLAYNRTLVYSSPKIFKQNNSKTDGYSVRCIKGDGFIPTTPEVTTSAVTNISQYVAISGGEVTNDGGLEVFNRGICWNTDGNPTTNDSHTSDGAGIGVFISNLTNLNASTTYYVRAYAKNNVGTAYGEQVNFTTLDLTLPTLITNPIDNISYTSAISGGNIISDGGLVISARGVCWSTSNYPTLDNPHTIDGTGTGNFLSILTDLLPNTTYYVRSYATNALGSSYGNQQIFSTLLAVLPSLTTSPVINITQATAISGGNIISDGGLPVTTRGVCWGLNSNPDIYGSHTNDGQGTGSYSSNITGLLPNTSYYIRAYATNAIGTSYGNQITFTTIEPCNGVTQIEYGGKTYNAIIVGPQCWMRENLDIGTMVQGNSNMTDNGNIEKYCYNNNQANCNIYGGLYQWNEMMQYSITPGQQGICPSGWHLPTDEEWKILEGTVDSQYGLGNPEWDLTGYRGFDAGGKLKESGTVHWAAPNTGATNSSNFTALPGGYRYSTGVFSNLSNFGQFWSSSEYNSSTTWSRNLASFSKEIDRQYNSSKLYGYSVRCLKDITPPLNCGEILSVTHVSGNIAPVNKTVNYGIVESNITGYNKCWITQNLGSDHQAISVTDATEASAGWYWQFNKKQGYKHDGATRTPNSSWISSINENSNWLLANDPCSLLLGNGWRLPTNTEWTNADVNGGWDNYNETYASVLKLHTAGNLDYSNGSLSVRGTAGYYWSSTQYSNNYGTYLTFGSISSQMYNYFKAYGFSCRCIKD